MKKRLAFSVFVILMVILGRQFFMMPELSQSVITPPSAMMVSFLDVGQGDSAFIEFPSGKTALIDAGDTTASDVVVDYINNRGHDRIDFLIATHPHADHIGGMSDVVKEFSIGEIYMPKVSHTSKTFERLMLSIQKKGLGIHSAKAGVYIEVEPGIFMDFVAPCRGEYEELNDFSAVIRLTYGEKAILFTGDAESLSEQEIVSSGAELKADILKVGHHGSVTSSSDCFLKAVAPEWAVISVGRDNDYGHPHKEILTKLTKQNITIYRTDLHGTVTVITDGKTMEIMEELS